jgi:hypothetical protein
MSVLAAPSARHHARLLWPLAALLLPCSAAAVMADAPRPSQPRLALVWFEPDGALPFPSEWVARELRRTLADLDLHIDWREGQDHEIVQPPEHPVILLREDPVRTRSGRRVMGGVQGRAASRPIWLFLSAIKASLRPNTYARGAVLRCRTSVLARALGRVLAHEVVHVIAPHLPHARTGLMRAQLRLEDLCAPWPIRLDPTSRSEVLRCLRRSVPDPGPEAARGADGPGRRARAGFRKQNVTVALRAEVRDSVGRGSEVDHADQSQLVAEAPACREPPPALGVVALEERPRLVRPV